VQLTSIQYRTKRHRACLCKEKNKEKINRHLVHYWRKESPRLKNMQYTMHGDDFSRAIMRLGGVANILGKDFATNITKKTAPF
jgi:hypothetical protein